MKQATIISLGLAAGAATKTTAFAPLSPSPSPSSKTSYGHTCATSRRHHRSISKTGRSLRLQKDMISSPSSSLNMLDGVSDEVSSILSSPRLSSFLGDSSFLGVPHSAYLDSLPTDLMATATRSIVDDPRVESELFTDASHVALDLITFVSPGRALLRLSLLLGRVFAIMADWVPDHAMLPEEMVFQSVMLAVSASLLVKSCTPMLPALLTTTSYREKRAYKALFAKYGLSWMQFKMVMAFASEWVEIPPNGRLADNTTSNANASDADGHVYWLQKGEAELIINDITIQHVVASSSSSSGQLSILGELEFARQLQQRKASKKGGSSIEDSSTTHQVSPSCKIKAGPNGATLLRIDATKLLKLMDEDDQLADSIRSIIFAGMQEKLTRVMEESKNITSGAGHLQQQAAFYAAYEHEI